MRFSIMIHRQGWLFWNYYYLFCQSHAIFNPTFLLRIHTDSLRGTEPDHPIDISPYLLPYKDQRSMLVVMLLAASLEDTARSIVFGLGQ